MSRAPFADSLFAHGDGEAMGAGAHLVHFMIVGVAFLAFVGYVVSENRAERGATRRSWPSGQRWLAITLLVSAAVGHVPVTRTHLDEAPYMGALFIVFIVAALCLATMLLFTASRLVYGAAGALCAAAVLTYVTTRLVALPQLAGDVGAWREPIGLLCVASELAAVVVVIGQLRKPQAAASGREAGSGRTDPRHAPGGGGVPGAYV